MDTYITTKGEAILPCPTCGSENVLLAPDSCDRCAADRKRAFPWLSEQATLEDRRALVRGLDRPAMDALDRRVPGSLRQ
jgi:hypothetical protein